MQSMLKNCIIVQKKVMALLCLEKKYIFMNDVILALIIYFPNVFNSLLYESEYNSSIVCTVLIIQQLQERVNHDAFPQFLLEKTFRNEDKRR